MALIPPFFLDCVLTIGFDNPKGERQYVATGFLYGDFINRKGDTRYYTVYLVTNKHVFDGAEKAWLRFNPELEEPAHEFPLALLNDERKPIWLSHSDPDIDLAVISINYLYLLENKISCQYFRSDQHIVTKQQVIDRGISEGDGVFILGFPLGLIGKKRNFVIIKQGAIARIRDTLTCNSKEFLIDASIYPGNSGGPVVVRPEFTHIQGTKSIDKADLIGVVSSYLPYQDIAVSEQTRRPRIMFEENSGLASVIPIDYVVEIIENSKAQYGQSLNTPSETTKILPEEPST